MVKRRLYWAFYKSTLVFSLLFPLLLAFSVPKVYPDILPEELQGDTPTMTFWNILSVCIMTFGPAIAFAYKEWARRGEYYFYYNQGISKYNLMTFCLSVNVLLGIIILIAKHYAAST